MTTFLEAAKQEVEESFKIPDGQGACHFYMYATCGVTGACCIFQGLHHDDVPEETPLEQCHTKPTIPTGPGSLLLMWYQRCT